MRRKSRLPAPAVGPDRKRCAPGRKLSEIEGSRRARGRGDGAPLSHWLGPRSRLAAIGWAAGAVAPRAPAPRPREVPGSRRGRRQRRLGGRVRKPRERGHRARARQVLLSRGGDDGRGGAGRGRGPGLGRAGAPRALARLPDLGLRGSSAARGSGCFHFQVIIVWGFSEENLLVTCVAQHSLGRG